jgi:hypothetical protein
VAASNVGPAHDKTETPDPFPVDMITLGSRKLREHLSPDHFASGAFIGSFGVEPRRFLLHRVRKR